MVKHADLPAEFVVKDSVGTKKYTLISTVDATAQTGVHFVSAIQTESGWVEANDLYNFINDGGEHGIVTRASPASYPDGRYTALALYELTDIIEGEQ